MFGMGAIVGRSLDWAGVFQSRPHFYFDVIPADA